VDGQGPLGGGDGAGEVAELGRTEKEIEAHRAILTAAGDAVKPVGFSRRTVPEGTGLPPGAVPGGTVPS
jgi:hypothetical protein